MFNPDKTLPSMLKYGMKKNKMLQEFHNLGIGYKKVDSNQILKIQNMPKREIKKGLLPEEQKNPKPQIISRRQVTLIDLPKRSND